MFNNDEYEDENPVVVLDGQFSNKPTNDRETVGEIIQSLATKMFIALQEDKIANHRYATRLVIRNRIKHDSSNSTSRRKKCEEFEIKLPLAFMTWNEMDLEDVQIQFLRRVLDINDHYRWYKVKARATHFMCQQTRVQIDLLEAEENPEAFMPTVGESESEVYQEETDPPATVCPNQDQERPDKERENVIPEPQNDEDEDIVIFKIYLYAFLNPFVMVRKMVLY